MEQNVVNELIKVFRDILNQNKSLSLRSDFMLACSKGLFYLENHKALKPSGTLTVNTSYKTTDGFNENGHRCTIVLKNNEIFISSHHYFKEAFGQHNGNYTEQLWPNEEYSFKELELSLKKWKQDFFEGLKEEYDFKENLNKLKIVEKV